MFHTSSLFDPPLSTSLFKEKEKLLQRLENELRKAKKLGVKLMQSEKTCDVTILIGKHRTITKAHKAVLAINSLYFEDLFFPEEKEPDVKTIDKEQEPKISINNVNPTEESKSQITIELPEIEVPEFEVFRKFCYTGSLELKAFDIALKVFKLADYFKASELKQDLISMIDTLLTPENIFEIFFITLNGSYHVIHEIVVTFIIEKATVIFSKQNLLNGLTTPDVISLLKFKLKVSSIILLERLLEYGKYNSKGNVGVKEMKKHMVPIFELVDFSKVGEKGMRLARDSGLVKKDKLLDVMLSLDVIRINWKPQP